ncbi:hypothetical protein ACA910_005909 [Epithemia clementina (nom. ined.)]
MWVWFYMLMSACLLMMGTVSGAHSRRRVVRATNRQERYDRSITTFDPNGRLLQVEYSMQAVSRGSPILCALSLDDARLYVVLRSDSQVAQQQLQVHRLDDHVFLFGTGLVGDTLFLANHLRAWCQQHRLNNGEPPTVREVAEQAASLQHEMTRDGGLRPIGCTAIVAGVDPFVPPPLAADDAKADSSSSPSSSSEDKGATDEETSNQLTSRQEHRLSRYLQLYRSGPGGAMEDCLYCAAGKDENTLMKRLHQEYPEILHFGKEVQKSLLLATTTSSDDGTQTSIMKRLARLMAQSTTAGETNSGKGWTYNVWTVEPSFGRRGNLKACCYYGVPATK